MKLDLLSRVRPSVSRNTTVMNKTNKLQGTIFINQYSEKQEVFFFRASGVFLLSVQVVWFHLRCFFSHISFNLRPMPPANVLGRWSLVAKVNEITDAESYASSALLLFKELGTTGGVFQNRFHRVHGSHVVFCVDIWRLWSNVRVGCIWWFDCWSFVEFFQLARESSKPSTILNPCDSNQWANWNISWFCCWSVWSFLVYTCMIVCNLILNIHIHIKSSWWFQKKNIFTPTWGRFPIWLIFFS